jgi:hypothetical protein
MSGMVTGLSVADRALADNNALTLAQFLAAAQQSLNGYRDNRAARLRVLIGLLADNKPMTDDERAEFAKLVTENIEPEPNPQRRDVITLEVFPRAEEHYSRLSPELRRRLRLRIIRFLHKQDTAGARRQIGRVLSTLVGGRIQTTGYTYHVAPEVYDVVVSSDPGGAITCNCDVEGRCPHIEVVEFLRESDEEAPTAT